MAVSRRKTKTLTVFLDPKYEEKLSYIKNTIGLTTWVEKLLDELEIDPKKLNDIKKMRELQEKLRG